LPPSCLGYTETARGWARRHERRRCGRACLSAQVPRADIAELLAFSVKHNASDLHLSAGLPPMIRVDGDIRRINVPVLDHKTVHELVYDIMNDKQRKDYEEFFEVDFSFEIPGWRVSASTPSTRIAAPQPCSGPSRRRS
jgi:hypothetical protein